MKTFNILENGEVINTILADLSFVQEHFSHYEEVNTALEEAKEWRNSELYRTDSLMLLPDYPYTEQLTVYRQALRDWPATENFPDTRPELVI